MLSFSNFGSSRALRTERIEEAIDLARHLDPDLLIDGPMQGNTALDPEAMAEYPFMAFDEPANVLICPNLAAANIAYKLLENLADVEMIGPILEGSESTCSGGGQNGWSPSHRQHGGHLRPRFLRRGD